MLFFAHSIECRILDLEVTSPTPDWAVVYFYISSPSCYFCIAGQKWCEYKHSLYWIVGIDPGPVKLVSYLQQISIYVLIVHLIIFFKQFILSLQY